MDVDPEIEGVYSGKSDPPSDSKSPAKPGCQAVGAETTTAKSPAVKKRCTMKFGSSDESKYSSRESSHSRSHLYDASAKHEDVLHRDDADDSSRVIVAVAIPLIAAILIHLFMSALRKKIRIVTCYDLLLKTNHGCHLNEI